MKNNSLIKSWYNTKRKKFKLPTGKQDFINKKEPIELGLKNSSGPENVKGIKCISKKINKMADNFFKEDINTYMKNQKTNMDRFDILYENLLNGMSDEERKELGVSDSDVDTDIDTDANTDVDSGDEVTITISKSDLEALRRILDVADAEDNYDNDDDSEDWEDDSEGWNDDSEDWTDDSEDEEVEEDTSFGEGIETEQVPCEKGKKYQNKASNKVGGKLTVKGGTANKGKIIEPKGDPEEVSDEKGKKYQNKASNKVASKLNAGNPLF